MAFDPNQFLTRDEALLVDAALLTSQAKFTTRIALYSLRTLRQIASDAGVTIDQITGDQILSWIQQDPTVQENAGMDAEFVEFFARLVMSSLKPLREIATATETAIADLTVRQVITWFEQQSLPT
ncbi:MAG: hypothetical protein NZ772_06860 [Cyanobacteria bacterium]|nr:hypothetical protein [Cyanobacteriota bacterium]MDW8200341.1 hypothetical protein [Cyanobacteriota bacterium SKYGB_h_bin112]